MRLSLQPGGLGAIEAVRDSDSNLIVAASGPGIEKAGLLVPVTCIRLGHRALANSSAPLPKLVVLKRLREENAAVRFILSLATNMYTSESVFIYTTASVT